MTKQKNEKQEVTKSWFGGWSISGSYNSVKSFCETTYKSAKDVIKTACINTYEGIKETCKAAINEVKKELKSELVNIINGAKEFAKSIVDDLVDQQKLGKNYEKSLNELKVIYSDATNNITDKIDTKTKDVSFAVKNSGKALIKNVCYQGIDGLANVVLGFNQENVDILNDDLKVSGEISENNIAVDATVV